MVLSARGMLHRDMALRSGTLAPVLQECVQFCLGRQRCNAVLETSDDAEDMTVADLANHRVDADRQPDFWAAVDEIDAGRHDADDVVGPAINVDRATDHRVSSECALPQLVREDRDRRSPQPHARSHRVGFSRAEETSVRRLHAERVEEVLVYRSRTHAQRSIACDKVHLTGPRTRAAAGVGSASRECPDMGKRLIHLPEFHVLRGREAGRPSSRGSGNCAVRRINCPGLG